MKMKWFLHVLFVAYVCTWETGCVILTSSVEEGGLVCPGEEVTFTCTVIEQPSLGWKDKQYISADEVIFLHNDQLKLEVPVFRGPFQFVLTSLSPSNSSQVANMTSTLAVNATPTLNGTMVECGDGNRSAEITLHVAIAGPPPPPCNPTYNIQQHSHDSITINVEWEYPEWMLVDNFVVTVPSFWSPVSIPGSARSATLTLNCNEVYTIEITATKCGNNSDPALLRVVEVYVADCGPPSFFPNGTVIYQNTTEGSQAHYHCNSGFTLEGNSTAVCGADGNWSSTPACSEFESGDDVVLQSQPVWTIAVMVVFIILASVCATFVIALFTLMFWKKHKLRVTKKSQEIPEQPGPAHAKLQPGTSDAHLEMQKNVAYSPIKLSVSGKFEMGDNVAYGFSPVGH